MWWNGTSPSTPWILKCVELGGEMTLCSHQTQNRSKVQWKRENRMKNRDRRSSDGFKKQLGLSSSKVWFCKCHMLAGGVFNQLIRVKKKRVRPVCVYISDEIKLRFHCHLREARASAVIGWTEQASGSKTVPFVLSFKGNVRSRHGGTTAGALAPLLLVKT